MKAKLRLLRIGVRARGVILPVWYWRGLNLETGTRFDATIFDDGRVILIPETEAPAGAEAPATAAPASEKETVQ